MPAFALARPSPCGIFRVRSRVPSAYKKVWNNTAFRIVLGRGCDASQLGMNVVGYDPALSVEAAWNLSSNINRADDLDVLLRANPPEIRLC